MTHRQLASLMVFYVRTHKVTTLPSFLSGVSHFLESIGLPRLTDLLQHPYCKMVRKGLTNYYSLTEHVTPKLPLGLEELAHLHRLIHHHTFAGARDWASYVISFFALLRRSEILDRRLTFQHVVVLPNHTGLAITVPFSKTNLQPATVHIASRDDIFCPVKAFLSYSCFIPSKLRTISTCPVFLSSPSTTAVVDYQSMLSTLKRRLSVIGLDGSLYGWHSWRRGGTTALFVAGVNETLVQSHGRWSSLTYRIYLDTTVSVDHALVTTRMIPSQAHPVLPSHSSSSVYSSSSSTSSFSRR